ncbi:MAG: sugar-binding transcriptional regulator [Devosia sp.]|nr:sugar-binding transcriptional regulator [Devosia sp.]
MATHNPRSEPDLERLLSEVAQRYYLGGETQESIASALGVSRMKVNRLLKQAHEAGVVEVRIRLAASQTQDIERRMTERFGLRRVLIAPDSVEFEHQRMAVASLVSSFLEANLKEGSVVTVGMGRNVAAVANASVSRILKSATFVCATGGASEAGETGNADHICRKLAQSFGGTPQTLYAPAFVPDPALRAALLENATVKRTFQIAQRADFALVGIGDLGENSHMVRMGWFSHKEITESRASGVVGDLMGYDFFGIGGEPMNDLLGGRVIGLSIDQLRQIGCVIAIASEASKVPSILGALRTGAINVLATSLSICQSLLSMDDQSTSR